MIYRLLFLRWLGSVLCCIQIVHQLRLFFTFWFERMLCTHYPHRGTVPAHALYNQMLGINFAMCIFIHVQRRYSWIWNEIWLRSFDLIWNSDGNTYRHGANVRHRTTGWTNERANVFHHTHLLRSFRSLRRSGSIVDRYMPVHIKNAWSNGWCSW